MADNFGNGVTRTLEALARQFTAVVWQSGKPPLDSELNLMSQVDFENLRQTVHSQVHSGFFLDPCRADDFHFHKQWSNMFQFGKLRMDTTQPFIYAAVNGMILPIAGTELNYVSNAIKLNPPPKTDSRTDFVFLEVWRSIVKPNPSTDNKPTAHELYKYGNVQQGLPNLPDDLEDPSIGTETTIRVQIQYRIRVYGQGAAGGGVALDVYPDGLEDPNVFAQGNNGSPIAGMTFHNMRTTLGDPSLWRAGDGDASNALNTVDGYVYAIPICAVFRRNSRPYQAVNIYGGAPEHNGGADRNPGADYLVPKTMGSRYLEEVSLHTELLASELTSFQVDGLLGSGLDDSYLFDGGVTDRFLTIGEGQDVEIISFNAVDANNLPGLITLSTDGRGRGGTIARRHPAGTPVRLYNHRPDHLYADEIAPRDVLDLRRGLNVGDWDFHRLLLHNVAALVKGQLRTAYKQNGAGGDSQGPVLDAVDYLWADASGGESAIPEHVDALDGPDGIRTHWSDASVIQNDISILLDDEAPTSSGFTTATFDQNVNWDVAPDFQPTGFMNDSNGWSNGSTIFLHLGGQSGIEGARRTFRDGATKAVRFVSPKEWWKTGYPSVDSSNGQQFPFHLRFLKARGHEPAAPGEHSIKHPGPMYPWKETNFERPFIVLGGLAYSGAQFAGINTTKLRNLGFHTHGTPQYMTEVDLGVDFDLEDSFYSLNNNGTMANDASLVGIPMLRKERTLFDLLTNGGRDRTGLSSELYIVLFGDSSNPENNGAFQVVGAGTVGYTNHSGSNGTSLVLRSLSPNFTGFVQDSGKEVVCELRTQYTHSEDGNGRVSGPAAACVVLTDIECVSASDDNAWSPTNMGSNALVAPIASKMVLSTSLMYHPSRGGTSRIADHIYRASIINGGTSYLRNQVSDIDAAFPGETSFPEMERHFPPTPLQLWNRLPSLGWHAPKAPNYGGNVVLESEQDREAEIFFDRGSKTLVWRPFQRRTMTLQSHLTTGSSLMGSPLYLNGKLRDGAGIFTEDMLLGFALPIEYMPRFGRQDIPSHVQIDALDPFLSGIHHLFCDSFDATNDVFLIIGGEDNQGTNAGNAVAPLLIQTGNNGMDYGEHGTIINTTHPGYQGRFCNYEDVVSSDLGHGLEGIELPPNLGIARIYGVYERQEYISKAQQDIAGGHLDDRQTPIVDPPTNLLRTFADKQTLFIRQGGGGDVTGSADDHTYIVPSNVIDHALAANYDPNNPRFTDYDYVVECVVFGFARGFINKNNYVLARRHAGNGVSLSAQTNIELEDVEMILPCATNTNDAAYVGYARTPYQGDPYMTRHGETRDVLDFQHRLGQVPIADANKLQYAIKQFDDDGNMQVQRPNPRAFEVLASLDFYTTMGTGKIGGAMYPGTITDVGLIKPDPQQSTRIPTDADVAASRNFVISPRAFTEGQGKNTSRAYLDFTFHNGDYSNISICITCLDGTRVTISGGGVQSDEDAGTHWQTISSSLDPNWREKTAESCKKAINNNPNLKNTCRADVLKYGTSVVRLTAVQTGEIGNNIGFSFYATTGFSHTPVNYLKILKPHGNIDEPVHTTATSFYGGHDVPMNAGAGESQLNLIGMTERLPMGILLQDADFIGENPLGDQSSAFKTDLGGLQPIQTVLPLAENGQEYERFFGSPGELIALSDGAIKHYAGYQGNPNDTGTKRFRIYRGGGAGFVLSGAQPGGPLDWLSDSMPKSLQPVLKGGALACKALLVRNFYEEAYSNEETGRKRSDGDEIQLVIMTCGHLGDGRSQKEGVTLNGVVSPTGFGEGYAAIDRYRINGRPMLKARRLDAPNPGIEPAPYPHRRLIEEEEVCECYPLSSQSSQPSSSNQIQATQGIYAVTVTISSIRWEILTLFSVDTLRITTTPTSPIGQISSWVYEVEERPEVGIVDDSGQVSTSSKVWTFEVPIKPVGDYEYTIQAFSNDDELVFEDWVGTFTIDNPSSGPEIIAEEGSSQSGSDTSDNTDTTDDYSPDDSSSNDSSSDTSNDGSGEDTSNEDAEPAEETNEAEDTEGIISVNIEQIDPDEV